MKKRKTYHCSRCGAERPREQLNGIDPVTGDDSHAYCIRILECNTAAAPQTVGELFEEFFRQEVMHG